MADGFGAITFGILFANPGGGAEAEYTVQHIPGGDVNYLDSGGKKETQFNVSIYLASSSDYNSLLALVGTTATFTYNATAYTGTFLASLKRTRIAPVFADAVFITP